MNKLMHQQIFLIGSLIIALLVGGCTGDRTDAEYVADAKALQNANKVNEAIIQLKNAISKKSRQSGSEMAFG